MLFYVVLVVFFVFMLFHVFFMLFYVLYVFMLFHVFSASEKCKNATRTRIYIYIIIARNNYNIARHRT